MNICITVKQAGARRSRIAAAAFPLENIPLTLRALIREAVHTCVAQYNERVRRRDGSASPLSESQMDAMIEIGKFSFGMIFNQTEANEAEAVQNALQAFEDGLYRIFLYDTELTDLDAPLSLHEGDRLTFIRLTMLSGSFF